MTMQAKPFRTKDGFTLIEILVVVAIISLLAAILFPVFARARENARRASCMSNLKQIALGWIMYAQDYDGKLPYYDTSVISKVFPYVKNNQVFICPSANLPLITNYPAESYAYGTSYGLPAIYPSAGNAALYNVTYGGGVTLMDAIPEPSITCLLAETVRPIGSLADKAGYDRFRANPAALLNITTDTGFGGVVDVERHFDGSNYAFMDGHAKWLKKETALAPHSQNKAIVFYWN